MNLKNKIGQFVSELKKLHPSDRAIVDSLYTLSVKSLLAAIIFTILITIFLYAELSISIVVWCSILTAVLLFRLYHAYLFKTSPQRYAIRIWYRKFRIYSYVTAVMVSMLGAVFIHYLNEYHQLFIVTALLVLTAGATISLTSDFRIAVVYISITMLPLIISMTMIHSSLAFILPVLITLFYFYQVIMTFNRYIQEKEIKELKGQQKLLNNLFEKVPLGMFSYDKSLNVLYANEHLYEMFNYKANELEGLNLQSLVDTRFIDFLQHILTQGPQSYTGPFIAETGDEFWLETTWFPFKNINDNVLGGVGIIEDKTEEHLNQKELKSLHLTLQDQIQKNQILLEENKQFIADMVHQIRTPLSVIMTNTSLIEMSSASKVSPYIIQINSAINMLSNAHEDLSYIIANDTIDYKPIKINLTHFLQERIDFFEVIAQANNKMIDAAIMDTLEVKMNDTELERLIDNNLSNAIKHSHDKSRIKVVLKKIHSEIILEFLSEGRKINNTSKIFDKNYTESYGAKRSLGLGLSMVKTICEKNHITYRADSENGFNTFTYIFKG